jgi:hypothetical protein
MALFNSGVAVVPAERRGALRYRLDCPAQLHLTSGVRHGVLLDMSETGARVQTAEPPQPGISLLLKWQSHEVFCRVIWTSGDTCGVLFDRPLSAAMLDGTIELAAKPPGPIAAVGKIPLGQKRSRP